MPRLLMVVVLAVVLSVLSVTSVASVTALNCSYSAPDGTLYDLSPLSDTASDYTGRDHYLEFHVNFCGPVVNPLCRGASACSFWLDDGDFHSNYGFWDGTPAPKWEQINATKPEAGLTLTFNNGGSTCLGVTEQLIMVLLCDPSAPMTKTVSIVEDFIKCSITITYTSKYACPSGGGPPIDACTWTEPRSKLTWDLWPLHRTVDYVTAGANYNYSLAICGVSSFGGACTAAGHSVCQSNYRGQFVAGLAGFKRTPAGQWNLLSPDPTVGVEQVYNNGEVCFIAGREVPRRLAIQFYCDPRGPASFRIFEDPNACKYTLTFNVPEGCPYRR